MSAEATPPLPPSLPEEIAARMAKRAEGSVQVFPRSQPIASDSDPDSCLRRQVLEVVRWKDKAPIPAERQGRLEVGREAGKKAAALLREIGLQVERDEAPFEVRHRKTGEPVLRGKVDFFVRWDRRWMPVEATSIDPRVFDRLSSVEDFMRYWWLRRKVYQLQAYLIGFGEPSGLLLATNLLGEWLPLEVALDYDVAERILARAEQTMQLAREWRGRHECGEGEAVLPPYSTDPLECRRCPFFGRVCNPPIAEQGAVIVEDEQLEADLGRWSELRQAHSDYEALDKRLKRRLRPEQWKPDQAYRELSVVGEFLVRFTPRHRKAFEVKATDYLEVEIERASTPPVLPVP